MYTYRDSKGTIYNSDDPNNLKPLSYPIHPRVGRHLDLPDNSGDFTRGYSPVSDDYHLVYGDGYPLLDRESYNGSARREQPAHLKKVW